MSLQPDWYSTAARRIQLRSARCAGGLDALLTVMVRAAGPLEKRGWSRPTARPGHAAVELQLFLDVYLVLPATCSSGIPTCPRRRRTMQAGSAGCGSAFFYANIVISWAIPFAVLLPRAAKTNRRHPGQDLAVAAGRAAARCVFDDSALDQRGCLPDRVLRDRIDGSRRGALGLLFLPALRKSLRHRRSDDRDMLTTARPAWPVSGWRGRSPIFAAHPSPFSWPRKVRSPRKWDCPGVVRAGLSAASCVSRLRSEERVSAVR